MSDSGLVQRLLADRSYHIEFNGHLTNHAKHAVVALAGLGASEARILEYYETYAKLTPYGYGLEPPRPPGQVITDADWWERAGRRADFSAYCDFFDRRERELGMAELLRRYARPLLAGWVGSFTHATIHLGWGLAAGSRWMAVEGLAYLAFSYVSCHPERAVAADAGPAGGPAGGLAGERAVDSLLRITGDWTADGAAFRRRIEDVITGLGPDVTDGLHAELVRSGLQYRIARLLGHGDPAVYQLPSWIADQAPPESWEQLYYTVTLLYLAAPGDFVLLHLITSLFAMEEIAARLPGECQREIITCFWLGMFPILLSDATVPDVARLTALHARYVHATDDTHATDVGGGGNVGDSGDSGEGWASIVDRAIQEEEEHNPKLVYVLRRLWDRTGRRSIYRVAAAHFTSTPELPPSFEQPVTD